MRFFIRFLIFITGVTVSAQSDYEFDYLLEYTNSYGISSDYYLNSKDDSYIFIDADLQQIILKDYFIDFNISLKGETRIFHVNNGPFEKNNSKVKVLENGKTEAIINGYKCKKYVYKLFVADVNHIGKQIPAFYEAYVMDDELNTIGYINDKEVLLPEGIQFNGLPKGTIVRLRLLEDHYFAEYTQLSLNKITKLEKPLKINITNQQATDFLLKNKSK